MNHTPRSGVIIRQEERRLRTQPTERCRRSPTIAGGNP